MTLKIPYKEQQVTPGSRRCGAASLVMVFRSFNKRCSQNDLWTKIKAPDGNDGFYGKSHKLCLIALQKGLFSLCIFVKDPIETLRLCQKYSIRAILGHRVNGRSLEGHFTVFTKIKGNSVFVNDPALGVSRGKNRKIPSSEILELMDGSGPELPKNLLLIFANKSFDDFQCSTCSKPVLNSINCLNCSNQIFLQPAIVIGCLVPTCPSSMIEGLVCPHCDTVLNSATLSTISSPSL
ncbi:MAG: hypothetical protein IH923_01635 [Nitrospinae bacterium]|nr:hypothetical protein [Nitrospinota bacterium]